VPFPFPLDPTFRLEVIDSWLDDVEDRIELGDPEGAEGSLRTAEAIYLRLPPGEGCLATEQKIIEKRVKLGHLQT
jgi:hypothetical protein